MHIFLDESGKPEVFSAKGVNLVENGSATKFLVLAAVRTPDQLELQKTILQFKLDLLNDKELTRNFSSAYALDAFHATKDYPQVRLKFYEFINSLDIEVHVIYAEKLKCSNFLQKDPSALYGVMAGLILQGICHQAEMTEIIFSRQDNRTKIHEKLQLEVERVRQRSWSSRLKKEEYILNYQHNPHYSHGGLQVADYIAYAVFQYLERNDSTLYDMIKTKIRHINDFPNKKHFTRSRPLELSS